MSFIRSLLASSDKTADSIVFGGLVGLLTLCAALVIDVSRHDHRLNALDFGGGKGIRNRLTPAGDAPAAPDKSSEEENHAGT